MWIKTTSMLLKNYMDVAKNLIPTAIHDTAMNNHRGEESESLPIIWTFFVRIDPALSRYIHSKFL